MEHGRYVAQMCIGCHGATLAGGKIPGSPPDWPDAADLRPGSKGMAPYADAPAFMAMLRSGQRPDGTRPAVMPFEALSKMNDVDMKALHLYLRNLPGSGA
jgi:mono/diheme cytochrome c family protein